MPSFIHSITRTWAKAAAEVYRDKIQTNTALLHKGTCADNGVHMQLNVLCPAGYTTGAHSNANNIYFFYKTFALLRFWFFCLVTPSSSSLQVSHRMLFCCCCFLLPPNHIVCTFMVIQTNCITPSCLNPQCTCKYAISQNEAQTRFMTIKMPFQNQSFDDSQMMISLIALLHCGDYNFTMGQAVEDPHKQEICSYSNIPQNAVRSQWAENVLQFVPVENKKLSKI